MHCMVLFSLVGNSALIYFYFFFQKPGAMGMITWFCVGTAGQVGNQIEILENESDFASIAMLNAMQC